MRSKIFIVFLFLVQLAFSQPDQEKSVMKITCTADSMQQYSLYLPEGYSEKIKYPVIIFLDPDARGDLPVTKYQTAANEYGVIMAGSYNSKNFDGGSSLRAFIAMYNDLFQHYPIDTQRIWLSGFSGGSRAAASIAMAYKEIEGVIACGAGFDDSFGISSGNLKAYAALVGERDMNYNELLENRIYLDEWKVKNMLLVFDGGHEWPPLPQMSLAISWMTQKAGKTNAISSAADLHIWDRLNKMLDSGRLYTTWLELKELEKIPILKEKAALLANSIEKNKNLILDKLFFEQVIEKEINYMNGFSVSFSQLLSQNEKGRIENEVWENNGKIVKQLIKDNNRYKQLSGWRCYDHSIRCCLEYYYQLMSGENYKTASDISEVIVYFDQESSKPYYLMARAEAGLGNKKKCEKNLKEAFKRGMLLNKRVKEDPLLLSVLSVEEITGLSEKK